MTYTIKPARKFKNYKEMMLFCGYFSTKDLALKYALQRSSASKFILEKRESENIENVEGGVYLKSILESKIFTRKEIEEMLTKEEKN